MSGIKEVEEKMKKAVESMREDFRNLRTGRANPAMLDQVTVEVYGSEMRMRDLANVSVSEPRQLLVTPYDPQTAGPIAKGIEKANLNVQPILESNVVRVPVPPLTEEIRKETVKQAKKRAEEAKVAVREVRRKANEHVRKLKADGDIPEDVMKKDEKRIQELTDSHCKEIDQAFSDKEKDIMTV